MESQDLHLQNKVKDTKEKDLTRNSILFLVELRVWIVAGDAKMCNNDKKAKRSFTRERN